MSEPQILVTERCGSLGKLIKYTRVDDQNKIVRLSSDSTIANSLLDNVKSIFREIFLPHGYPDSVSDDYFDYQIWDTVQAFCSTITGTFTTQAILKGVGVGNVEATPLAAAITWVTKDGTGMIGRIIFAWWKGNSLDGDCKKWRLFADFLNDFAMFLELLVPYFESASLHILCATTAMKAMVGVAGGATRASITQHQAIKGNMADVSAKDGSQETFVNLIASVVGIILLAVFTERNYEWFIFAVLTFIHLFANYNAVRSLVFSDLNNSRLVMVLKTYLRYDSVPSPQKINLRESVILGYGLTIRELCGFDIKIGTSLKKVPSFLSGAELRNIIEMYKDRNYLLLPNMQKSTIYVALEKGETADLILTAYFHAVLLAIGICNYNNIDINVYAKRQLHHITPFIRLHTMMKFFPKSETGAENIPAYFLAHFNEFASQEVIMFFTALQINGWNIETHSVSVGQWRADWKIKEIDMEHDNLSMSSKKTK